VSKRPDLVKDPYRVRGRYTEDGRPRTFDAMNWREARDRAAEINRALEEGRAARSKTPTFARVWKQWYAMREEDDLAPSTRRVHARCGRLLEAEFGRKPIDTILPIDAERWLKALAKSKPALAESCLDVLGQVFRFARRKKYLSSNPFLEDPVKLPPKEGALPWVPRWDVMERIVQRGQERRPIKNGGGYPRLYWSNIKTAIALGGGAGLRISEVVALRWEDIKWEDRVIKIRRASTSRGPDDLPKKKKIRDVPMTQWIYDALFEHMHVLQQIGKNLNAQVILNRKNPGQPISTQPWSDTLRRFLAHAGVIVAVEDDWRFHALRRFYISARFALGHRELDIREAVAHSSLETTFKHYARALPEPPGIWQYRFRPAEPDDQPKVIDGTAGAVVVDGMVQLSAPCGADSDDPAELPQWAREAKRYLEGGWKVGEVVRHIGYGRRHLSVTFRKHGLPPPIAVYRAALHRRFEQMYNDAIQPCDIATQTGVHISVYERWQQTHEAGLPHTTKSLKELMKPRRGRGSVATDAVQTQLSLT
jgi:integrase